MSTHKNFETEPNTLTARGASSSVAPLKDVLFEGASELRDTLGHMAHDSKGAVDKLVHDGKSRLGQMVEDGRTRVGDWKSDLSTTIRNRPIQSLLIVAGIGAAVGMFLRRRSR